MASNIFITPAQSRGARAMLGRSYEEIREAAGLGQNTLQRWEKGHTNLNMSTVEKLVAAYEELGVCFPDKNTVQLCKPKRRPKAKAKPAPILEDVAA